MKTSFFSLRRLLGLETSKASTTPEAFEIPLGLSPRDLQALKDFRDSEEFEVFLRALDEVVKFHAEALLGASTNESLHYHRGMVMGIRKAASLVDEIRQTEEAFLADKRRRTKLAEPRGRSSVFFGSPGWGSPTNT